MYVKWKHITLRKYCWNVAHEKSKRLMRKFVFRFKSDVNVFNVYYILKQIGISRDAICLDSRSPRINRKCFKNQKQKYTHSDIHIPK